MIPATGIGTLTCKCAHRDLSHLAGIGACQFVTRVQKRLSGKHADDKVGLLMCDCTGLVLAT